MGNLEESPRHCNATRWLARWLRERPSYPFRADAEPPPPAFRAAEEGLLPLLNFGGYKLDKKAEIAVQVIHQLVLPGLRGCSIADTRDTSRPGVRLRVEVWDALVAADLAVMHTGSQWAKKLTRYGATHRLLDLFPGWELAEILDVNLERNTHRKEPTAHALILLRTGKRDPETGKKLRQNGRRLLPLPRSGPEFDELCILEDRIEAVNRSNLKHSWCAFATDPETGKRRSFPPNPCLRLIYVGRYGLSGRLYTWSALGAQSLTKAERRSMLIDDEPVSEYDYSGHATRCLYHLSGIDVQGDVYRPEAILLRFHKRYQAGRFSDQDKEAARNFVKRCTNTCWNVASESEAVGSVFGLLRGNDFLNHLVFEVERTTPAALIRRIRHVHRDLDRYFFYAETGAELMTLDGRLMLAILERFARAGKPALAMHDGVVVRRRDATFARRTLIEVYREFMGFAPVVKREFPSPHLKPNSNLHG